jgi:hypothetical protein
MACRHGSVAWCLACAALLLSLLSLGCSRNPRDEHFVDRESVAVTSWLNGGDVHSVSALERHQTPWRTSLSWSAESPLSWSKLIDVLTSRPPVGYESCATRDRTMSCVRRLPGDIVRVEIREIGGAPLRVLVTVTADAS